MRRRLALALALAAVLAPALVLAEDAPPVANTSTAPTGLVATVSLAGGGELGLESGKAGVFEIEGTVGYELEPVGLRPEIGATLGIAPDQHVALRPGVRWSLPGYPIQLRAAVDLSNARDQSFRARWLLLGVAGEVRLTSLLGLYAEIDTGAPLWSGAGLPLLVRTGASLRF